MNIYLLKRNDSYELDWDEYRGFVISAKDKNELRKIVNEKLKESDRSMRGIDFSWFNCELVGYKIDSKNGILMEDFNQG